MNFYKLLLITLLWLPAVVPVHGQSHPDDLFISNHLQPVSEDNIFKTDGYYNWGASIIRGDDGKYHLFYSRWKREYGFLGWLLFSEVAHAVSKSPTGPWKYKETVLRGRGKGHWDAITAHNPKIKYFDGKYYLYYCSTNMGDRDYTEAELIETAHTGYSHTNWKILRPNQRTGVAVSNSLNGPWKRSDKPLIEPSGPITTLTVNPAIARGRDNRYYLIVKGDKPNEARFIRNQAIAISDAPDGPFVMQAEPVIDYIDTEDMSMWYDRKRDRFYGVFHTRGFIGMVTSADRIHWRKATEYILMSKVVPLTSGDTLKPDRLERPFIYTEDDEIKALSLAVKKGDDSYTIFIPVKKNKYPLPNKAQMAWQDAELGVVIHYDLHVFDGRKYSQAANRIIPVENYNIFNPSTLDTDQWIRAVRDMGATFAILTATHETGFALYQSDVNPYCLKAVKWKDGKGDIVRDFVNSCRKYGIKPGIYLGIRWNSFFGVHNFVVQGEGKFRENRQAYYNKMVEGMVKEICTRYGELFEIWFDGGADSPERGAPDVLPIVKKYQPECLFYHNAQLAEARWGGSESGTVPYPCRATFPYPSTDGTLYPETKKNNFALLKTGDPGGKFWMPAMSDAPLHGYNGRHEWFWEPGNEAHIFPVEHLMKMYYHSVGHNSTLILGVTPDTTGLLPEADVRRMKEFGDAIRKRFSTPLALTSGHGKIVKISLPAQQPANHVILMEDIAQGERVRKFTLEGKENDKWITLFEGSCIGHKLIIPFEDTQLKQLRIKIEEAIDIPVISNFSVYFVNE